jgi:hypothetical protein
MDRREKAVFDGSSEVGSSFFVIQCIDSELDMQVSLVGKFGDQCRRTTLA